MISTAMAALLQTVVLSASPTMTYEQAYAETEKTGKPLVVLIGADWCGAWPRDEEHGTAASGARCGV